MCTASCGSETQSSTGAGGSGGQGGSGGAAGGGGLEEPPTIVWLGAHPDDELYAAPWLAKLCLEDSASCRFVVMTHGELGNCKLADGCTPDLDTVRQAELQASAQLFGAELIHLDLGDGTSGTPEGVLANWSAIAGDNEALLADLAGYISNADRVITFDPRHGSSCHADHRATATLAIAAATMAGLTDEQVTLVGSALLAGPAVPEDTSVWAFDASLTLSATGKPAWHTLLDVLEAHPSQFTADEVAAVAAVPPAQQQNWFVDLNQAELDDPRYANLCP